MKVLCVFGKYAYGDEARGLSPEFQAFVPALARNGHDVVLFDSWNRAGYSDLAELNARLLATIESERPEVMLFVPFLYEIWIETLSIIKNRGDVLSICWTTDDSWKYAQQSRFIAPAFHAITTTYPSVLARYRADGIEHAVLTQWAAPDDALMPPLKAAECSWQVTFVGANHGNRKSRLEWLRRRGIPVEAFGYGWPNGPVSVTRMRDVIRRSVISLNFANSRGDNQIKARTFEVPGAGGFLLTESAPSLENYYRIGEEVDSFRDLEDLEQKIRHYLADSATRDAMAVKAFERTRDEHTYSTRFREVFAFAVHAKEDWEKHQPPAPRLTLDRAFQQHRIGWIHRAARAVLVGVATLVAGRTRGRKAARRLLFELSLRLTGMKTYTAAGLPGRWFPKG